MECDESPKVSACANEIDSSDNISTEKNKVSEFNTSCFLTASDLCSIRGNASKNKNNDVDVYKGPKVYYPSENPCSSEVLEGIMDDQKKSLELQRVVKSRDCVKAEWDEELKVAIVPHLKGKTAQYMGVNLKGNCALSPQEALFLLEKGLIEIEHNNAPLSIEEAYAVMLKGKLSIEKYEVYSFLSLQGFIVVHHQSRIGPSYNQLMNLEKRRERKRKAEDGVSDSPEVKRLTFTGVLASNSEASSVNVESSTLSNDSILNTSDSQKVQSLSQNIVNSEQNVVDALQSNEVVNREESITLSPDLVIRMDSNDSVENNVNSPLIEQVNKEDKEENPKNPVPSNPDHENCSKNVNADSLTNKSNQSDKVHEKVLIENTTEDNEIDIENSRDEGDTDEIIIEDDQKIDKSDELNVDDSLSDYYDETVHTDESVSETCEETNDKSLDIYSCSPNDSQVVLEEDLNSETDNVHCGPSTELDDDITLVEVKKTEKKPLAVIDLLSDDDDDVSCGKQQKKGNKSSAADCEQNGQELYEDSDDEIQVLKVCPVQNNSSQTPSNNVNCIKSELKTLKFSINSANMKFSFRPQMKFPDLCKKDIMCLPRPPRNLLPQNVDLAKEAYVINYKSNVLKTPGRLWNSYKDLQEYQRDMRRERNNREFRGGHDFIPNQVSQVNSLDDNKDFLYDRNIQGTSAQFNRLSPQLPMNPERGMGRAGLLPTPGVFNPPNHNPFMNIHNLQNLSSSNPAAFVNEIQKTVYSVASSMISSWFGPHFTANNVPPRSNQSFNEPVMDFNSHSAMNNFNQSPPDFQASVMPGPMVLNNALRNDFPPVRFPPVPPLFPGDHYSASASNAFMADNNMRPMQNFRPRFFQPRKGPLFPCTYRNVNKKKDWHDVIRATNLGTSTPDSGSDIEEVPININQFLCSNDIQPLVKPGSKLPVSDVLKSLQITQRANLYDANCSIDRYMPNSPSLEISFDVYLPNSKYRRSAPSVPNCRVIVVRAADAIPRYSELVCLKKKWNDQASLQLAVVDHGDISFYSFNNLNVTEIIPFES